MSQLRALIRDKLYRLSFMERGLEDRTKILRIQYQRMMDDLRKLYAALRKRCYSFPYPQQKHRPLKKIFNFSQFLDNAGTSNLSAVHQRLAFRENEVSAKRFQDFGMQTTDNIEPKSTNVFEIEVSRSAQNLKTERKVYDFNRFMISSQPQVTEKHANISSLQNNQDDLSQRMPGRNISESEPDAHLNVAPIQARNHPRDSAGHNRNVIVPNFPRTNGIGLEVNNGFGFANPINNNLQGFANPINLAHQATPFSNQPNSQRIPRAWRQYFPNSLYAPAAYNSYWSPYSGHLLPQYNQNYNYLQELNQIYNANRYPSNNFCQQQSSAPFNPRISNRLQGYSQNQCTPFALSQNLSYNPWNPYQMNQGRVPVQRGQASRR